MPVSVRRVGKAALGTRGGPGRGASIGPEPLWYKNAVIYELHVRSFADSTGDGIGDFNGLVSKLDYLADLGVTAIWLLPFYPSPLKDDGYDTADYTSVNPMYGTIEDVQRFINEAHARDLKVITELVINHTSDQHPWFQRARRAPKGSPERDFYVWSDSPNRYAGTRIIFKDFETSNWAWDPVAQQYFWHRFYSHQPDLNFDNPAVHDAVLEVLDFWMRMGVDGMRLDAVPYLYEREGTSCENLPETHAFLRKIRAHVDQHWPGRMLLAEANQWPEDAIAYFGNGDECHMAFHFPLMPRLFMSLRMEDRFPIIDILEQTPPIPPTAQWALFLRNHDELTLEMVTDEERDYMYRVYATDREARINLGIRRRLAPLLSNSRRKIELLNALLFSFPGTPVIYYGDEIGMGDNVHLGDRDGVRTPMQWSGDRNAGFSRANPQRLFLPAIIDPEYHYETINVESQQANTSSLLWWMKRLIALRKRHPVFGHGDIRFLGPANRRILAFIRCDENEHILVVANMSRFVQPVSLDLADYRGWRPVEMFGQVRFPEITDAPYFLSLGPHSFYWFILQRPAAGADGRPAGGAAPEIRISEPAENLLAPGSSTRRLDQILPYVLPAARWFTAKARELRAVHITGRLPIPQPVAEAAGGSRAIAVVRCEFAEGEPETFALPLALQPESGGDPHPPAIARIVDGAGGGHDLFDAMADGEFARVLLQIMLAEDRLESDELTLIGTRYGTSPAPDESAILDLPAKVSRIEQSNSNVVFGEEYLFKLFRRLDAGGENPELEIGRHLTRIGFRNTAPLAGSLELLDHRGGHRLTLGVAVRFVPNQGDAWSWMRDRAVDFMERAATIPADRAAATFTLPTGDPFDDASPSAALAEMLGQPLVDARQLGLRTADLHAALADDRGDPAFTPEPFTLMYQRSLFQSMRNVVRATIDLMASPAAQATDGALRSFPPLNEKDILALIQPLTHKVLGGARIRNHGDYHLGQVLRTGGDFTIIDFEGEPLRSIGERRLKRSPLRDVAGMIRSFDYAAWAGLRKHQVLIPGEQAAVQIALASAAAAWSAWMARAFTVAYVGRLSELNPTLLGPDRADHELLLRMWLIEKALYEIRYELNARPDWVDIPLRAMAGLIHPHATPLSSTPPPPEPPLGLTPGGGASP